jgi:hypothetical protein
VENDIMGFVIWRQVAQVRDGWRIESGVALILLGEWRHRTGGRSRRRIKRMSGLRASLNPLKFYSYRESNRDPSVVQPLA